jgi:hypothetical protein
MVGCDSRGQRTPTLKLSSCNVSISTTTSIMADSSAPEKPLEAQVAALHLDSVTGEMVSKSELKKREKLRKKEAYKADKPQVAQPTKKANVENAEKELTPNVNLVSPLVIPAFC